MFVLMISARRDQLLKALQDKEYRQLYMEEHVRSGPAFQIRAMREARGWTQAELGNQLGKPQAVISQIEDPDYGRFQLRTLLNLAAAFDVALIVRFAPYSELLDWTLGLSPQHLKPPSFDDEIDPGATDVGTFYMEFDSSKTQLMFNPSLYQATDVPETIVASALGDTQPILGDLIAVGSEAKYENAA
jgi:transcriptional regulator with XRE-family HTH domain